MQRAETQLLPLAEGQQKGLAGQQLLSVVHDAPRQLTVEQTPPRQVVEQHGTSWLHGSPAAAHAPASSPEQEQLLVLPLMLHWQVAPSQHSVRPSPQRSQQVPFAQSPEQQSPSPTHGLPAVRHVPASSGQGQVPPQPSGPPQSVLEQSGVQG